MTYKLLCPLCPTPPFSTLRKWATFNPLLYPIPRPHPMPLPPRSILRRWAASNSLFYSVPRPPFTFPCSTLTRWATTSPLVYYDTRFSLIYKRAPPPVTHNPLPPTPLHLSLQHFEKMGYDQPPLATAYLTAFQITGDMQYARTARAVLDYMRRDLTLRPGGPGVFGRKCGGRWGPASATEQFTRAQRVCDAMHKIIPWPESLHTRTLHM